MLVAVVIMRSSCRLTNCDVSDGVKPDHSRTCCVVLDRARYSTGPTAAANESTQPRRTTDPPPPPRPPPPPPPPPPRPAPPAAENESPQPGRTPPPLARRPPRTFSSISSAPLSSSVLVS